MEHTHYEIVKCQEAGKTQIILDELDIGFKFDFYSSHRLFFQWIKDGDVASMDWCYSGSILHISKTSYWIIEGKDISFEIMKR